MTAASAFMDQFDEDGRYGKKDGEVAVIFLDKKGQKHPGSLHFIDGKCVRAEMDGYAGWSYEDDSPLLKVHFLLHFEGEDPHGILIDDGRVVQQYDQGHPKR